MVEFCELVGACFCLCALLQLRTWRWISALLQYVSSGQMNFTDTACSTWVACNLCFFVRLQHLCVAHSADGSHLAPVKEVWSEMNPLLVPEESNFKERCKDFFLCDPQLQIVTCRARRRVFRGTSPPIAAVVTGFWGPPRDVVDRSMSSRHTRLKERRPPVVLFLLLSSQTRTWSPHAVFMQCRFRATLRFRLRACQFGIAR